MPYSLHTIGQAMSPWWFAFWAGAVQGGAALVNRAIHRPSSQERIAVPPVSKAWLLEHEKLSGRHGEDL